MTTPTADPQPQLAGGSRTTGKASPALRIRRGLLIASPVLAALLAILGSIADPAAGISGREMYEIYAEDPEAVQFKALALHWSYAFWIAPALLLVGLVRGRGAWLANIAGALAFAGLTTMPGLLFVDFYDSAIGQLNGADAAVAVSEHMDATMWAVPAFAAPGAAGFLLALPLTALALWRAGLVRWWAAAAAFGAIAAFSMLSSVELWGAWITPVCLVAFAVAIARATSPRTDPA